VSVRTALVLISHSAALADGCAQVAAQMAPQVDIRGAGGTDDGQIGTSYDLVEQAVTGALAAGAQAVVLFTDLGSATLTAESVMEMLDDERVLLADAPFVEGAVAAAVAAQGGAAGSEVLEAGRSAATAFASADAEPALVPDTEDPGEAVTRTVVLRNRLGLHARPAAMLARRAAEIDATARVNDIDATSVLALMGLGLTGGAELHLKATGPQAQQMVAVLAAEIEAGFGEE